MPEFAELGKSMVEGFDSEVAPDREVEGHQPRDRKASQAAEASGRRYRFLAKAIPQIVWTASPTGLLDSFNPRWTEYTGLPPGPNPSRNWRRGLHAEDVPRWVEGWKRARVSGSNMALDVRLRRADGSYRWHLVRASPIRDRAGVLLKWLGTCTDIDDQKRAEGMLGFLAEVSTLLASSLDYETTLAAVARMAVPHVADWCSVDMLEPGGKIRRLAVAHLDPAKVALGWELARRCPPALGDPRVPLRVLETGRTELTYAVDDEILIATAQDPEQLAMLRAQGCTSSIVAALAARGRNLGVITFAMAESGRRSRTWPAGPAWPSTTPGSIARPSKLARRPRPPTGPRTGSSPCSATSCGPL
jgi:PAS domain S-box-containing protein